MWKASFKGYTLVEVLVAIVIFSTLIGLGTTALNQVMRYYEVIRTKDVSVWKYANLLWLNRVFLEVMDYYVSDDTGKFYLYFIGTPDFLTFASFEGISTDKPVLVYLEKQLNQNGNYDLLLYQLPLNSQTGKDLDRYIVFKDYKKDNNFIYVMKDLDEISFEYYIYDFNSYNYRWSFYYEKGGLIPPKFVKISYKKGGKADNLIFLINNNSLRKSIYNETYQK